MSKLICISGSSGVGKTTLSRMISFVLGADSSVHLCGDDLHLWERGHPNWDTYTHLNPHANNLEKDYNHILSLQKNKKIQREFYNHDTGKFDPPVEIESKPFIIHEGLHSLYGKINELSDIKIFVETDKKLKRQWKINRDVQKRGYTAVQVENVLRRRESDEEKYIQPQKKNADAIVTFSEKKDGTVHLEYISETEDAEKLMKKVKILYDMHREFLLLCKKTSFEHDLVQHGGGNVSYKFDGGIIITSSGRDMSEVMMLDGFSPCDMSGTLIDERFERPSMEVGFHVKVNYPVVYHTHPIYLNIILCSNESRDIIQEILKNYDYDYVPYVTPGKDLEEQFDSSFENNITLLENHGLVCSGRSFSEVFDLSLKINQLCKEWLIKNSKEFKTFSKKRVGKMDKFLFPDAVVLQNTMKYINQYMIYIQRDTNLTPRFLSESEVKKLLSMEEEKYRISLK